ncbi:MAG: flippase-like domain-containing protein [Deltaproteobacteria bacterium]|jgi:uncharacterized protein (TIRG00374 family)
MTFKRLHAVLLTLGVLCLVCMLHAVGAGKVWRALASLGWGLIPLILIEGIGEALHTGAWRQCLSFTARSSRPFAQLFWMRVAGYAINYFTPTASLGGEVTRASLIASPDHAAEAISAVLVDKACMALAQLLLVVAGACFLLWQVKLPTALQTGMLLTGSLLATGIFIFLLIQKQGRLGAVLRWLASRRLGGDRWRKLAKNASAVDEAFRIFYRDRRRDFALALGWHMAGFATGFLQTGLFFVLVNQHPSVAVVAGVWAIGLWFDLLVFAVPMSLGTLEASRIVTFAAVGYQAVEGMAYGMVLRLGQLSWAVLGLLGYAVLTFRPAAGSPMTVERQTLSE